MLSPQYTVAALRQAQGTAHRYFVVVLGFLTGLLGVFVLPALPAPAVGFLTAGFLAGADGFAVDFVGGFTAGLLVGLASGLLGGLAAGLAVVPALVFFTVVVEGFAVGFATSFFTDAGLEAAVFAFTVVTLDAFWAGAFATAFAFTVAAFAVVFVFTGALLAVLAVRSLLALPAVVFLVAAATRFPPD